MNVDYPTLDEPATADYVLAVLRDLHRQSWNSEYGEDPEDDVLSFDTTVRHWRAACDLAGWRQVGRAENEIWQIDVPDAEWKAVLEPAKKRRLRDVCELIARHARRPQIRPTPIMGHSCRSAGAFLTIRSFLHQAGAPAEEIAPSTPLAPFLRRHFSALIVPISKLAPGALPGVRVERDAALTACFCAMPAVGFLLLLAGSCFGLPQVTIAGGALFVFSWVIGFIAALFVPASVEIGDLRTFRDLAKLVADAPRLP